MTTPNQPPGRHRRRNPPSRPPSRLQHPNPLANNPRPPTNGNPPPGNPHRAHNNANTTPTPHPPPQQLPLGQTASRRSNRPLPTHPGRRGPAPQPRPPANDRRTGLFRQLRIRPMGRRRRSQTHRRHARANALLLGRLPHNRTPRTPLAKTRRPRNRPRPSRLPPRHPNLYVPTARRLRNPAPAPPQPPPTFRRKPRPAVPLPRSRPPLHHRRRPSTGSPHPPQVLGPVPRQRPLPHLATGRGLVSEPVPPRTGHRQQIPRASSI